MLGGLDITLVNRLALELPILRAYAQTTDLAFHDVTASFCRYLHTCLGGRTGGATPRIAILEWSRWLLECSPSYFPLIKLMRRAGIDATICNEHDLRMVNNRVVVAGRNIDLVLRAFQVFDDPAISKMRDIALMLKDADCPMVTPAHSDLLASKLNLVHLTDLKNRHAFTQAEAEFIERCIPLTRRVASVSTDVEGSKVDLVPHLRRSKLGSP